MINNINFPHENLLLLLNMHSRVKHDAKVEPGIGLLHDKPSLPIYSMNNKFLTTQDAVNVLLDPDLKPDVICTQVPFSLSINGIFVVDLSKLNSIKDLLCDDMGVWTWNGSFRRWCTISQDGLVKLLEKNISSNELRPDSYRVWKRYYFLKASPDVRKMLMRTY